MQLDRPEEMARVTAAGGVVFNYGGVLRVQGILAKTRALGTFSLDCPSDPCTQLACVLCYYLLANKPPS